MATELLQLRAPPFVSSTERVLAGQGKPDDVDQHRAGQLQHEPRDRRVTAEKQNSLAHRSSPSEYSASSLERKFRSPITLIRIHVNSKLLRWGERSSSRAGG